uniref:Uncharacterized protein n=1 Tax=Timema bartmani TaxID=61472 RepID=A0A7R9ER69_9NEOP|nr:unnamed protein product [Timema bartmani]
MASTEPDAKAPPQMAACRMLRSPSHESVTTDLSLFSVSSIASEAAAAVGGGRAMRLVNFKSYSDAHLMVRGPSPNPDSRGQSTSSSQLTSDGFEKLPLWKTEINRRRAHCADHVTPSNRKC